MLNLKKGLALVLAAATAFTFAPVANLTAPKTVEAANVRSGFTMRIGDTLSFSGISGSGTITISKSGTNQVATISVTDSSKLQVKSDGTVQGVDVYYVSSATNTLNVVTSGTGAQITATGSASTTVSPAAIGTNAGAKANVVRSLFGEVEAQAADDTYRVDYDLPSGAAITITHSDGTTDTINLTDTPGESNGSNTHSIIKTNELTIPYGAYTNSSDTSTTHQEGNDVAAYITGVDQTIRLQDGSGFYLKGVKILRTAGDRHYTVSTVDSGIALYDNSKNISKNKYATSFNGKLDESAPVPDTAFGTRTTADGTEDYITLDIYVTAKGSHTFVLSDDDAWSRGNVNSDIRFTVSANYDESDIKGLQIYPVDGYVSSGVASLGNPTQIYNTNEGVYELDLNKYVGGYAIAGLSEYEDSHTSTHSNDKKVKAIANGTYVYSWTGAQVTSDRGLLNDGFDDDTANHYYGVRVTVPSMTDASESRLDENGFLTHPGYTYNTTGIDYENGKTYTVNSTTGDRTYASSNKKIYTFKATAPTTEKSDLVVTATKNGKTIATKTLKFTVDKSNNALDTLYVQDAFGYQINGETNASVNGTGYVHGDETRGTDKLTFQKVNYRDNEWNLSGLNLQVQNKGKFIWTAESKDVEFRSEDSSILSFKDATSGEFTVGKAGKVKVYIFVGSTNNNYAKAATINVTVNDWAVDHLTVASSVEKNPVSNQVDLDYQGQTATPADKATTLTVKSAAGLKTKFDLSGSSVSVAKVDDSHYTVTSTGTTGLSKITITSLNDSSKAKRVNGNQTVVYVRVWDKPAAQFTLDAVTVNANDSFDLNSALHVTTPATWSVHFDKLADPSNIYSLTNKDQTQGNTQTTSRLYANNTIGTGSYTATILGTSKTRPTTHSATVTVLNDTVVNTIVADTTPLNLSVDQQATVAVATTQKKAFTVEASNDNVTAAVSGSSIVVTGKKAGTSVVTIKSEGAKDVKIGATVAAPNTNNDVTVVPAKVSKIKLYNVKGAKLKINYSKIKGVAGYKVVYKYKKNGKLVRKTYVTTAGSKTVSVPKKTSVKVWVRAYNLNSKNQRVNGAYKTATKKTDNK